MQDEVDASDERCEGIVFIFCAGLRVSNDLEMRVILSSAKSSITIKSREQPGSQAIQTRRISHNPDPHRKPQPSRPQPAPPVISPPVYPHTRAHRHSHRGGGGGEVESEREIRDSKTVTFRVTECRLTGRLSQEGSGTRKPFPSHGSSLARIMIPSPQPAVAAS